MKFRIFKSIRVDVNEVYILLFLSFNIFLFIYNIDIFAISTTIYFSILSFILRFIFKQILCLHTIFPQFLIIFL